jgi:hypothetical protein
MKRFLSTLCASALTASAAATGVLSASAAPAFVPKAPAVQSDVIQIRDRVSTAGDGPIWKKRFGKNNNFRRNGKWKGNGNWKGNDNWDNDNWDSDYGWYNGHRGYRYKHGDYDNYYNGYWYPAAAFVAGALIGGAIANNNRYYNNGYGSGSAHVQWCYDHYRSYREYDNTFQPFNGPRRQCYSPYG